ncbi:tetratricopeptide repeat protein [Stieleria sp. JC731]|uniref:tetratricopeptide repeat protein n=1 Tax=Pirellulaceae TaxID=2691357 RepID=UPI001E40E438|nr:tetratricopeptide repeat protein [Stieleria sp. JC731]MCC9599678.1 tetratricopeptide repeat protein [Stieleria sp. JC731]
MIRNVLGYTNRSSRRTAFCRLIALWTALLLIGSQSDSLAAESTEESIALYADAANAQTGGAYALAINNWKKFLDKYPDDQLASKAAHYLGVCHMQKESPDYGAAATAFALALKDREYELREESLANLGWCYYAAAGDGPKRDEDKLRKTIETFDLLRKEKPRGDYSDRALFYTGEAAYGLGDLKKAIDAYNRFLKLPNANESPLRCDALYARGIAYEELSDTKNAIASFQALLDGCAASELAGDVLLRMGDLRITAKDFTAAIDSFQEAFEKASTDEDKAYALFRQAFALVQAGQPGEAALRYDRLEKDFADTAYAANATLAAGQSLYRAGETENAAERFEQVLSKGNPNTATEAAHWLARIFISKQDNAAAIRVAKAQLENADGPFLFDLQVDLAEALASDPATVAESIEVAEKAYRSDPEDPLASRALYNAAFSLLQINRYDKAGELANEFVQRFANDPLAADVQFIAAESDLMTGKIDQAITKYQSLLAQSSPDDPQRPVWVLRTAMALNRKQNYDACVGLLKQEYAAIKNDAQKAEAQFLMGQAHMMLNRPTEAATAFEQCVSLVPNSARAMEASLLRGNALLAAGETDKAKQAWTSLVDSNGTTRMADQARYKLAQVAADAMRHQEAIELYQQVIQANRDPGLIPYALYGLGWSNMQINSHEAALAPLSKLLDDAPSHALADDALLARGISYRTLSQLEPARRDLESYLAADASDEKPSGENLGHALYELAIVEQKSDRNAAAAERLEQLIKEVPDYPGMDEVLYELAWSYRQAKNEPGSVRSFRTLQDRFPDSKYAAEAAYFVAQDAYQQSDWESAAQYFRLAADKTSDNSTSEKALYRLGWSLFKAGKLDEAKEAFSQQAEKHSEGAMAIDALMMVGECAFKLERYEDALKAYQAGRERIQTNDDSSKTVIEAAERQVRELILLHGGQASAQLGNWDESVNWYDELKTRFPATAYLPQVYYETGVAFQQKGDNEKALDYFKQVADRYRRREIGARARFMAGEIYFGNKQFDKAIPEFQAVMFGFGGADAPSEIKNWQAKSGFEAGRCSELLMQGAQTADARDRAKTFATQFYQYVVDKHAEHELVEKSAARLKALGGT